MTVWITPLVFLPIFVAVFSVVFLGLLAAGSAVGMGFLYSVGFDPVGDFMRANGM